MCPPAWWRSKNIRSVDLLQATPAARDAMAVVLDPPGLDDEARELWRDLGQVAIGSLPGWARSMYGYGEPVSRNAWNASPCASSSARLISPSIPRRE